MTDNRVGATIVAVGEDGSWLLDMPRFRRSGMRNKFVFFQVLTIIALLVMGVYYRDVSVPMSALTFTLLVSIIIIQNVVYTVLVRRL